MQDGEEKAATRKTATRKKERKREDRRRIIKQPPANSALVEKSFLVMFRHTRTYDRSQMVK